MSQFTDASDWCVPVGGIDYRVTKALEWYIGSPEGRLIVVPVGRIFNVSIPEGLRWLFSPHDPRFLKAAAIHDEMLHHLGFDRLPNGRVHAAGQFHHALLVAGVPVIERLPMLLAVLLFKYR
jgi:hypothetical protein